MRSKGSACRRGSRDAYSADSSSRGRDCNAVSRSRASTTNLAGGIGEHEVSRRILHRNFPARDSAEENVVVRIGEKVLCPPRGIARLACEPQKAARIEQNSHGFSPLKYASNSSGSGSKNSGPSLIWPSYSPMGRGFLRLAASGRISAMGWLRRHKQNRFALLKLGQVLGQVRLRLMDVEPYHGSIVN